MSGDDASDERRLFGERREEHVAFVASELGLVRAKVAADRVGEFALVERSPAQAVAADEHAVAVATDEDVLVGRGETFTATEFGPAVAVGLDDDSLFAANPAGHVGRLALSALEEADETPQFQQVGEVTAPRRFDGAVLATGAGVFGVDSDLTSLGLDEANDVAVTDGTVYAATDEGLVGYDGHWRVLYEAPIQRVSHDGITLAALSDDGTILQSRDEGDERFDELDGLDVSGDIVDIAQYRSLYAVSDDGCVHVAADPDRTSDGQGGWRSKSVGVRGVVGLSVAGPELTAD